MIFGGKKVSELLTLYKERHFTAVFGFYANLYTHSKEFHTALEKNAKYWKNPEETGAIDIYINDLQERAMRFLKFFMHEKNQIPPREEPLKWEMNIFSLQDKLSSISHIKNFKIPNGEEFYFELKKVLEYFNEKIPSSRENLLNEMFNRKKLIKKATSYIKKKKDNENM
jgi:hypothetical protein